MDTALPHCRRDHATAACRSTGFGAATTPGAAIQPRLDEPDYGWRDADRAVDRASARFGAGAVRPAALVRGEPVAHPGSMPRAPGSPAGSSAGRAPASTRRDRPDLSDGTATATQHRDLS